MANTQQNLQQQATGARSGKELAMLVGVLLMVAAGMIATYWVGSSGLEEARAKPGAVATSPAAAPTPSGVVVSAPTGLEAVHADVYFNFKSAHLRADAVRVLQETAAIIDRASAWVVLVQGYADRQGPPEYNKMLAQRRAETVKQFLVELGVPDASVRVVTIGQNGSLCDDPGKECHQINRRVHLEIRKLAGASVAPVRATPAGGTEPETRSRQAPSLP